MLYEIKMEVEKKRAEKVVIIEWVLMTVAVVVQVIIGCLWFQEIIKAFESQVPNNPIQSAPTGVFTIVVLISVGNIFSLLLNILLTRGVRKDQTSLCEIWYIVNTILIVLYVLVFILDIANAIIMAMSTGTFLPVVISVFFTGGLICYRVWAVNIIMDFTTKLLSLKDSARINIITQDFNYFPSAPSIENV